MTGNDIFEAIPNYKLDLLRRRNEGKAILIDD